MVAPGQHEIDFRYDDVLTTADNITTFRFVVKNVATRNGLHATFMPKPIYGINGSGMHTHMSLFSGGTDIFYDSKAEGQLGESCLNYIGGILRHAKGFCAITNPLVNSYKRLVPGYRRRRRSWSEKNRSPLVRVPATRGTGTRIELRMPISCNPYSRSR
jgi:glutamine synthetase